MEISDWSNIYPERYRMDNLGPDFATSHVSSDVCRGYWKLQHASILVRQLQDYTRSARRDGPVFQVSQKDPLFAAS